MPETPAPAAEPGAAARQYHALTKHAPASVYGDRFTLDFANQPRPYKLYPTLDAMPLPRAWPAVATPWFDALTGTTAVVPGTLDLATVAQLCLLSNGITKYLRTPGGEMAFRAAPCTGALYHVEVYVVCADLPGLPAGVYHYGAHDHTLRQLRAGDHRAALVAATGAEPATAQAPVVIVSTSTFWRNAWKYRDRAYRHVYWDDGAVLSHLLALAAADGQPARVVVSFADAAVNALLGVDGAREAAVSLLAVGSDAAAPPPIALVEPLDLPVAPLSDREVDYPAIHAVHAATSLPDGAAAQAWRAAAGEAPASSVPAPTVTSLPPLARDARPSDDIETVIRRRGSARRFSGAAIGVAQLDTLLDAAMAPVAADFLAPACPSLIQPYLIVNAVDGLASGTYAATRVDGRPALELLRTGSFQAQAGALALGQALGAEAAVNVYFLADLDAVYARLGDRGYRAAQLEAAIRAGRLYLGAYALRLGASGLTFFDDAVTNFFSPHAAGKSVLFLVALGHPLRRGH